MAVAETGKDRPLLGASPLSYLTHVRWCERGAPSQSCLGGRVDSLDTLGVCVGAGVGYLDTFGLLELFEWKRDSLDSFRVCVGGASRLPGRISILFEGRVGKQRTQSAIRLFVFCSLQKIKVAALVGLQHRLLK
jgi:hypothetical protein